MPHDSEPTDEEEGPIEAAPDKPASPWARLCRKGLWVVVVLLAFGLVWLGWGVYRGNVEAKLISQIEQAGGHVLFDYQVRITTDPLNFQPKLLTVSSPPWLDRAMGVPVLSRVVCVEAGFQGFSHELLANLNQLPQLQKLDLRNTQLSNPSFVPLAKLPLLRELSFRWTFITPQQLQTLAHSQTIAALHFEKSGLTDESLRELKRFSRLSKLTLTGPTVTGPALASLADCEQLQVIELRDISDMTNEDLQPLVKLTHLKTLILKGCRIDPLAYPILAQIPSLENLTILDANYNTSFAPVRKPIHSLEDLRKQYEAETNAVQQE
ncbi:hypothetical protein C5Y97_11340 [Blastopirellula marina]|uniref:Leucine-rich repeat domain-containing protein n=2 Tax=Blastopirellula marina TaxID=124 RepID=A0A2S8FWY8_9BACT|nr:hypothetical protein C5Y98_11330 [Blastopirellula marina]PTL44410.1 hypothetical protein C5Y97_11340 [Blastopirellula marina]